MVSKSLEENIKIEKIKKIDLNNLKKQAKREIPILARQNYYYNKKRTTNNMNADIVDSNGIVSIKAIYRTERSPPGLVKQ